MNCAKGEIDRQVSTVPTTGLRNHDAPKGKALSNAMRSGKRVLAGVAAGALGAALVPFIGVTSAQAADYSGTTTAVRQTSTDGVSPDAVPYAKVSWSGNAADDTAQISLSTAPSGSAKVAISGSQGTSTYTSTEYATLGSASTKAAGFTLIGTDDSAIYIAASQKGSYVGQIQTYDAGAASKTVSFSFTTTGAPASFTMAVNSPEVPLSTSNTAMFTLTVKDADGNKTQILGVDGVTMSTTESGAFWPTATSGDDTDITGAELYTGTINKTMKSAGVAGSFTATATPTGTPWASAQTGSYTVIGNVAATGLQLVSSGTQVNWAAATGSGGSGIAKLGSTTLTFGVTVNKATNAGKKVVVNLGGTAFSDLGLDNPASAVVTTDANGEGSFTVTVPSASAFTADRTVTAAASSGTGTYTAYYKAGGVWYCTDDYVSRSPSAGVISLPTGSTQAIELSIDDSFGDPVSGQVINAVATSSLATSQAAVTGSDGKASMTLPTPTSSSTTSVTWNFKAPSSNCFDALTVKYSATGDVTIASPTINTASTTDYTGTGSASSPAVVPYGGYIRGYTNATASDGKELKLGATVGVGDVNVELSGPSGVWFCKADDTYQLGTTAFGLGCSESSMTYTASGTTLSAYVQATKTGTHTITATTTSGATVTWDVTFGSADAAARNVSLSADPTKQSLGGTSSITVSVTDVFGNPVKMTTGGAKVTLVTDLGTLAGGTNIYEVDTTTSGGTATVSLASATSGLATVTGTGSGGQFGDLVDVPYTGATASVDSATTTVQWTTAPTDMSITISGERTTVKGKPGIAVDGITTGISEGEAVIPYIKFPGETSYSAGSARPKVDAEGEFYWQRKTGKKIYVYFVLESDMDVRSERIIIQAK